MSYKMFIIYIDHDLGSEGQQASPWPCSALSRPCPGKMNAKFFIFFAKKIEQFFYRSLIVLIAKFTSMNLVFSMFWAGISSS
jgi:hypothetical protein